MGCSVLPPPLTRTYISGLAPMRCSAPPRLTTNPYGEGLRCRSAAKSTLGGAAHWREKVWLRTVSKRSPTRNLSFARSTRAAKSPAAGSGGAARPSGQFGAGRVSRGRPAIFKNVRIFNFSDLKGHPPPPAPFVDLPSNSNSNSIFVYDAVEWSATSNASGK